MATSRTRKRPGARRFYHSVAKPSGLLHPRVQQAGPEHFGIVCFDCAKLRSKFFLADFYGRVLIPPPTPAHNPPDLDPAVPRSPQPSPAHHITAGPRAR